jgi:hypothetical protein
MLVTKKHIPRRTFLRGIGVTLALPMLDAMLPAQTPSGANKIPRFLGVWHPHGASPGYWSPELAGSNFEFSYETKPLEAYRNRVVLISGLDSTAAFPTPEEPGGDHSRGAVFLSGARPRRNAVTPYLGTTIDQMIAQKFGRDTLLPSIQLGIEDPGANTGVCNWGYSCAYSNSVSWSSATQPLPTEVNPRMAFERLFGDGSSAAERAAGRKQNGSILDGITREVGGFKKDIGASDRVRLDNYLENVREIERRLGNLKGTADLDQPTEIPFGIPESKDEHFKLMYDLVVMAFQADITRSATLMTGRDTSPMSFPASGFDGSWHATSHHDDNPNNKANYAKLCRYLNETLAYFVEKVKDIPDGDGTLLDHMLIYKSSNMGNSHRHAHEKVPTILIGGLDGAFKGNRHIVFPDNQERTSNLLLSILDLYGIHQESIGDSTGPLQIV